MTLQREQVIFRNPTYSVGTGMNEAYGVRSTGENPYYYATGPGATNSMIPLTSPGLYSSIPPKRPPLPIPPEGMDNYIQMASASREHHASTSYYNTVAEKVEKDEQLYAEIPHSYNPSGVYQVPGDVISTEESNKLPENHYVNQKSLLHGVKHT